MFRTIEGSADDRLRVGFAICLGIGGCDVRAGLSHGAAEGMCFSLGCSHAMADEGVEGPGGDCIHVSVHLEFLRRGYVSIVEIEANARCSSYARHSSWTREEQLMGSAPNTANYRIRYCVSGCICCICCICCIWRFFVVFQGFLRFSQVFLLHAASKMSSLVRPAFLSGVSLHQSGQTRSTATFGY